MRNLIHVTFISFFLVLCASCGKSDGVHGDLGDAYAGESGGEPNGNGDDDGPLQPGVITAGEWNDMINWDFWQNILQKEPYKDFPGHWSLFLNNRISVNVTQNGSTPVVDAQVSLKRADKTIFVARTDNRGNAELWVDVMQESTTVDYSSLTLDINEGAKIVTNVKPYHEGVNAITIGTSSRPTKIDICFVVDATGSMGDELEYLKTELVDVLSRVERANPNSDIATASVFYRDEGDEYVTRVSPFTQKYANTINFISKQSAAGGGDFPEAVHTALEKSIDGMQWSSSAKARLLFLLLDAPPHHNQKVLNSLQQQIRKASEKGIKIIPITASGIDKSTEFLMRFLAVSTNGTYVFITNHSGIGNDHLEPSVGEYEVEFLNDLMVRLINTYAE